MNEITVFENCNVATMAKDTTPYGLIENAKLVVSKGIILWVGAASKCPDEYRSIDSISLENRLVTPSLIDCHTHIVFGGNRAKEFELRLQGASYEEIARQGGGILSTVTNTRKANFETLLQNALLRVDALMAEGVRAIEIKSGYGLSIADEIRMLEVAAEIEKQRDILVKKTWLAAHAVPPEYKRKTDAYIDEIVIEGLKQAHTKGLIDAVDGFCETIGFTPVQMKRIFDEAKSLGLPVKLHAEQLSDLKGALLVGQYNGLSADHLEYLQDEDVPNFAKNGTVAVLLPGAFYTLKETKRPPISALRKHNVDMAVATDCNPGSSPLTSLLTAMNMACTFFDLTPEEALAGTTRNAAKALGIQDAFGKVATDMPTNLAVWNVSHPAELSYWIGSSPLYRTISPSDFS